MASNWMLALSPAVVALLVLIVDRQAMAPNRGDGYLNKISGLFWAS
jgi:hypothetical protein